MRFLKEFDITGEKKLSELSYGQKKKFLLAFGMASGCRLLLLDEPTNGLDIPSKSQFRKLLAQTSEPDRIILISTHQVRDLENLIDPVIILDEGKIIFQEYMQDILQRINVRLEQDQPDPESILYSDKVLGGYLVVRENTTGKETKVDLETLFNTVTVNKGKIKALFQGGRS
jgi:ABC-2 type transport system ATP-binding protein